MNKSVRNTREYRRLLYYLEEIRKTELEELGVDIEEYEAGRYSTDYSKIITLVEEALYETPEEDCRY